MSSLVLQSFDKAKSNIRMEEPIRLLTRLALNFTKYLFLGKSMDS